MLCTVKALLLYCKLHNFVNILAGDGFNLFQNFRDSHGKENMQNPRKITTSSTNWFFSLFASNKGKMATEGSILCSLVHSTHFSNDRFHDRLLFKNFGFVSWFALQKKSFHYFLNWKFGKVAWCFNWKLHLIFSMLLTAM